MGRYFREGLKKQPSNRKKGMLRARSAGKRRGYRRDEEAAMGVGTLIIFISMVIIAAMAAGVMLYGGNALRDDTRELLEKTTESITKGIDIITIIGDRNENGNDSTVLIVQFPGRDSKAPLQGNLLSVSVTPDGVAPLTMELEWNSGVDLDTGLREEKIYRASSLNRNSTLDAILNLDKIHASCTLIYTVPFDDKGRNPRTYVDYTVKDEQSLYYAYAIVGVDMAGNEVLYRRAEWYNQTDNTTRDEDIKAPGYGGLHTVNVKNKGRSVFLDWTMGEADPDNTGKETPLMEQHVYAYDESLDSLPTYRDSTGKVKVRLGPVTKQLVHFPLMVQ